MSTMASARSIRFATARPLPRVRTQVWAAALAVVAAVALPQVFHMAGAALGVGTALGETLLPMHLPVLLVGLLAGPYAGVAAGALGPLASFALSGMPMAAMLPFMVVELAGYGLVAGLLRTVNIPTIAKVLLAQVAGRVLRTAAVLVAVVALGDTTVVVASVWTAVLDGLPGLVLQWAALPLIVWLVDRRTAEGR